MPISGKQLWQWVSCITSLLFFLPSYAYILLPLNRLSEKGIHLSHMPGHHDRPIMLVAEKTTSSLIVYTKDGKIPLRSSPDWGKGLLLEQPTALTIGLINDNKLSDTFYCGTYLIQFQSMLPVSSLIIPPDDLLGEENGIYVGGLTPEGTTYGNCWKDIEKETFFEYFDKQQPVVAQGCGLKIFGGMTRQNKEKSLRVIAREKYGKGKFKYRFFQTKEREVFNSIVLRTSGNDYLGTRFLDMMISSIAKDMKIDYLAYQPSVLFVNGTYWGIHNLREKMNDDYLEENYGVSPDSTDLLLGNASAEVGSSKKYRQLFRYLEKTPPDAPGFIDSLEQQMDIRNYFNYLILEIHIINTDSRGNVRYWSSSSLDEKFRWVYYDGDLSFGNPRMNYLGKRMSDTQTDWYNPYWTTLLLRKLMQNPTLRQQFITQYCFLRSTLLSSDTFTNRIRFFRNWLEPEIDRHLVRKDFKQTRSNWEKRIQNLIRFAQIRDSTSMMHLKEIFSLGKTFTLSVNGNAPSHFYSLWLNGNKLPAGNYSGQYFKNIHAELEIRTIHPLYRFVRWSDGDTRPSRSIPNHADSLIQLTAILQAVPFSPSNGFIRFQALATGRTDKLSYLYLTDSTRRHGPYKLYINNLQGDLPLECTVEPNRHQIVLCNSIARFKRAYPDYKGQLIESSALNLRSDIQSLYLFNRDGQLLDSVNFRGIKGVLNTQIPFYIRDTVYLTGTLQKPLLAPLRFRDEAKERRETLITFWCGLIVSLLLIAGLPRLIIRKVKSASLVLLLLLQGSVSFSQVHLAMPVRQFNPEWLLKSDKIHRQLPEKKKCIQFYCSPVPVTSRLIWVAPFANDDLWNDPSLYAHLNKYYKEFKSDEWMQVRMLYHTDTIRNFIRAAHAEIYPLDSAKTWKLIKLIHSNGMESWYYPVRTTESNRHFTEKGAVLGIGSGRFYWQIRYRQRSFALDGLLTNKFQPDPKGYFLEAGKVSIASLQEQFDAFIRSIADFITY